MNKKISTIYHDFLKHEQDENNKSRGKVAGFHASATGSCFRKQMYSYYEYETSPIDDRSLRVLRLGTIVHSDVENAMHHYMKTNSKEIMDNKLSIFSEHKVQIPELNVIGTLDIAIYNAETEVLEIYDVKTAAAFTWSKHFGRKENRQENANQNYKLQLGTYGLAMQSQVNPSKTELYLFWYNKNTSMIREQIVHPEWIDKAFDYWTELNELFQEYEEKFVDYLEPGIEYGVPFEDWECRYCPYESICPSTLAQRKERKPRQPRKRRA
jgi:hypothetical protein